MSGALAFNRGKALAYHAHSLRNSPRERWHSLAEHLEDTGDRAAAIAEKWDAEAWGHAAGRLHDIGKFAPEFRQRLLGGPPVDHATAGAKLAVNTYGAMGRLLAYVIAGHHGGMPDGTGVDEGTLEQRLAKRVGDYSGWSSEMVLPEDLPPPRIRPRPGLDAAERMGFAFHVWARMLFSALCDADFLDTEAFYATAYGRDVSRRSSHSLGQLARQLDRHLSTFSPNNEINRIRAEVLSAIRSKIRLKPGLFTLTVPTGGGKTLASLAWALGHARVWSKDRVIYVIPFTSIIDQTARVFREALGERADALLEHHSAYRESANLEAEAKLARAAENWDAPVVLTTAVQFFESLFSNRPSRCRKLHNIANSVVILDEAQTLPPHLLRPCLAMLDELARNYGASILLCTATQPAVTEKAGDPRSLVGGLVAKEVRELMPPALNLHERLQRVTIAHGNTMDDAALVAALAGVEQGLVIVNTRRHARDLYRAAENLEGACHLSALMYPAHRAARLGEITAALKAEGTRPVRLIATTVVEAGIDVDFRRVWRALAGLDNIAQAAGRCNRGNKRPRDDSLVTIFEPADPTMIPMFFRPAANAARRILRRHADDPLSPSAILSYFESFYGQRDRARGGLDAPGVLDALVGAHHGHNYPYAKLAEDVSLIDDAGLPVIVPRGAEGQAIVKALARSDGDRDPRELRRLYRQAQQYTVQIPPAVMAALQASGAVVPIFEGDDPPMMLEDLSLYREDVGLDVI
jgi:CRISPR-associated endonuclease/helicase Cas3